MPSVRSIAVAVVVAAVVGWQFPLVHFRRLDKGSNGAGQGKESRDGQFDAKKFAEEFWTDKLTSALNSARDAGETLAAIRKDPQAACRECGRTVGLSRACLYLVQGRGVVTSIEKNATLVALDGESAGNVALATGLIFGNTIRDATGSVDTATMTDSAALNGISAELNRLAETRAVEPIKSKVAKGSKIRFVGCAQVQGTLPADQPWKITPLRVEFE